MKTDEEIMKQEIVNIIRKFHLTNEIKTYDQAATKICDLFSQCQQDNAERKWTDKEINKLLQDCAIHFGVTHIPKDDGTTLHKISEYILTTLNKQ